MIKLKSGIRNNDNLESLDQMKWEITISRRKKEYSADFTHPGLFYRCDEEYYVKHMLHINYYADCMLKIIDSSLGQEICFFISNNNIILCIWLFLKSHFSYIKYNR